MNYPATPQAPPEYPPQPPQPRKRHLVRNIIMGTLAGFGAIVLAAVVLASIPSGGKTASTAPATSAPATPASSAPATPAPTPSDIPSGPDMQPMGGQETLTETDTGTTISTLAISSPHITTYPAGSYGSSPQHGYYVIVTAKAGADQGYASGYDVSTSDFYALAAGQHYDEGDGNAYDALSDVRDELGYTTLAAGETTTGKLVFDVPSQHGEIVYAPNYDGQPVAEWSY